MKTHTLRHLVLAADLGWAAIAMGIAYLLRYAWLPSSQRSSILVFVPPLLASLFLWSVLSSWLRLDGFRGGWRVPAVLSQLLPAVLGLMAIVFAGAYAARFYESRLVLGCFGVILFLGFVGVRLLFRSFLVSRYRAGAVRKAVIVGSGPLAKEMAANVDRHPELLCQIVGFLCPAENATDMSLPEAGPGSVTLQTIGIVDLLQSRGVDEIILTVPKTGHPEILELAASCRRAGLAVSLIPQPYELYLSKPELTDLDGLPLLQWEGATAAQSGPLWKRALDLSLATCMLPLSLLAIAPAVAMLKLRKGRSFCRELRCGQHGKTFWMYRLNSERNATGLPSYEFLLQRSSLTELPQLLNVLRGEMSLVGPRPEGPERIRHYSDWHKQRLNVKPGMTGLAQVHGLRDQHSSEEKTKYDLQYILHNSPFQDISLLLQTAWTIAPRLFQVQRIHAPVPHTPAETRMKAVFEETLSTAHTSHSGSD
jgi:lipopolysaccharide/colanic/teichoic acid biosynthesis glycosyltransferase